MIQRQHRGARQAGFIRKFQYSKINSMQLSISNTNFSEKYSQQFSPFKDFSPQPLQKILHTHRVKKSQILEFQSFQYNKNIRNEPKKTDAKNNRKPQSNKNKLKANQKTSLAIKKQNLIQQATRYLAQKQKQKFPQQNQIQIQSQNQKQDKFVYYDRYQVQKYEENQKSRIIQITQSYQQIKEINCRPEQINLSLAEAFNLHCHKIKQRLEKQRIKFSKSKTKRQNFKDKQRLSNQCSKQTKYKRQKIQCQGNRTCRQNIVTLKYQKPRMVHKNSDAQTKATVNSKITERYYGENKQNQSYFANNRNVFKDQKYSLNSSSLQIHKNQTFFIPANSSRSKPITPRQAYQHSLKKWRQLPEVIAKQKQREKEAKMRERLVKMKAHSLEVRNKLKK